MSAVNETSAATPVSSSAPAAQHTPAVPFWQRRAFFRYGALALILGVWELIGPSIDPIFFSEELQQHRRRVSSFITNDMLKTASLLRLVFIPKGLLLKISIMKAYLSGRCARIHYGAKELLFLQVCLK